MSDEEDNTINNVIYGPWGSNPVEYDENQTQWIKQKYGRELDKNNTHLQIKEKLAKLDMLTENVMVQMIHTLSERGYDITDSQFILDVGFLSEVIKGVLSRQENLPHIIQPFIEQIMSPERTESEDGVDLHYSRFDSPLLGDVIEMLEELQGMEDGDELEMEISFESDTELPKLSDEEKEELRLLKKDDEDKDE